MIVSQSMLKRAYEGLVNDPQMSYEQWENKYFGDKEINYEYIKSIVELWNSKEGLTKVRKIDANVRKPLANAIKTYGLENCQKAIDHYAEVLNSDFFFKYYWNIRTFFKQGNALPDFMDDGNKWVSYLKWKNDNTNRPQPYSKITINKKKDINDDVDETLKLIEAKLKETVVVSNFNLSNDEYEQEVEFTINNTIKTILPIVYAYVAVRNHNVYLDTQIPVPTTHITFSTKFDNLNIYNRGQLTNTLNIDNEYNKLKDKYKF